MEVELLEIRDFLAGSRAFRSLPERALAGLTDEITIHYLRRDSALPSSPSETGRADTLELVRSGAIEIRSGDGSVIARHGEGECVLAGRSANAATTRIVATEDSLLYRLPASAVERLRAEYPAFAGSLETPGGQRLRLKEAGRAGKTSARRSGAPDLLTTRLGEVVAREAVWLSPRTAIRDVAARMNEARVTSMLLVEDGSLVGIVTDRDLRRRVIVEGIAPERAVSDIMTPSPIVAGVESLAHDALLLMARHGIHHLPVVDGETLVGLVTASDFVERRSNSTVRLAASIHRADSVDALVAERERIDALYASLVRTGASASRIGRVTSGVVDALTVRLLELAEAEGGRALPDGLVWLVAGSQARREWHIGSVAANAPLLDEARTPRPDDGAIAALARFVDTGLARCGFATSGASGHPDHPCSGTDDWLRRLSHWLDGDGEQAGVPAATMLDLRAVRGEEAALSRLRAGIADALASDARRVERLARSALRRRPPLGFFRNAVLDEGGGERATLDLAADAVRPIVDLARVHALVCGDDPLNTRERLVRAVEGGELDRTLGRDLDDALDFAAGVRARRHARHGEGGGGGGIYRGDERRGEGDAGTGGARADDRVSPAALTAFERHHLEDVFSIVRTAQDALAARHAR